MAIAVITGAANGIGRELARGAVARGMQVALIDRDAAGLRHIAEELGSAVIASRALDTTEPQKLAEFAAEVAAQGTIALLFANAGILRMGTLAEGQVAQWSLMIDVNLKGTLNTIAAFLPILQAAKTPSRIVITGSEASFDSAPTVVVYCATKHALWAIADGLHHELGQSGHAQVAVSLMIPGIIATSIAQPAGFDATDPLMKQMDAVLHQIGSSPAEMAKVAFDGIDRGDFYICFRADVPDRLVQRAASVKAGRPLPADMQEMDSVRAD